MSSSSLRVFLLFISLYTAGGFQHYEVDRCNFNSTDLKDIEFSRSFYYNKLMLVRFSSSVGKFEGFTKYGLHQADYLNNLSSYLEEMRDKKERYCQHNIKVWYSNILSKSVEPEVIVHSVVPPAGGHPAMLVCSVYDFYPKYIKVSWQRDGEEVSQDVTSTDELADGDWFYQLHSHLEYTPRSGEKISCVVEHASLKTPLVKDWDPSMPESERNQIAIGASGLILGLILSLAGFIYFKRKSRGRILVPNN
ncbi:H-2 class II histocompatibility antigen, E-S beta chain-like isoform X1 [Takifugu flavidus]|uniref:H-2 class II histocompatibility antigen, E-S beta chain-like isoform X1 n=1 Tax=Takifugu flavidus TaxID=433684 RepID=UPI002543FCFA|nr:H-2 class II histocompatibility antigen, E-S beta chain-like isoform X1 [Takifugu flavidus]